jgi:Tfp pilus assembly protein PilO
MNVSPRLIALAAVALAALVAVGGWYGVVGPQKSKADDLDVEIVAAQEELNVAKLLARSQQNAHGKEGIAILNTAMPPDLQMPSVVRQVQRLAESAGVVVQSFAPSAPTPAAGYDAVPIAVSVLGRYGDVQRFLQRMRAQAGSSGGKIQAAGRLFDVQDVSLAPSGTESNQLAATLRLAVFVYTGTPLAAPETETTPSDSETDVAVSAGATEGSS